ncbi:hypothetical protein BH10ACI4_BH10ACI4_37230 [soil metagenome]
MSFVLIDLQRGLYLPGVVVTERNVIGLRGGLSSGHIDIYPQYVIRYRQIHRVLGRYSLGLEGVLDCVPGAANSLLEAGGVVPA